MYQKYTQTWLIYHTVRRILSLLAQSVGWPTLRQMALGAAAAVCDEQFKLLGQQQRPAMPNVHRYQS